jgi:hypothetical protein
VTRDRARKQAIRARMAATGEPYNVAARRLGDPPPASDAGAAAAITRCAGVTLAEPSARIEFRTDWEIPPRPGGPRRSAGVLRRLVRRAAGAAWARAYPDLDTATLRDTFAHQVSRGYLLPAGDQYLVNSGVYAQLRADGKNYGGRPGAPLTARHEGRGGEATGPLGLLGLLRGVTEAQETLRGTVCRLAAVRAGSVEATAWVDDDEHVRKVEVAEQAISSRGRTVKTFTVELWDFGVPVDTLDWSRLPNFEGPG